MYRKSLAIGVLSISALGLTTGCVDDKYDITDLDTTSRFTVDNLTVPLNVSEIKLENVISLDDNENIDKVVIDGKECYAIVKGGEIEPTEFNLATVHVNAPQIDGSKFNINIPSIPNIPGVTVDIPEQIIPLPGQPLQDYAFNMNVDKALKSLYNVKSSDPIEIKVVLKVPAAIMGSNNKVSFQNIKLKLPWGLMTDANGYNQTTGDIAIDEIPVGADGTASFRVVATGLDLLDKGTVTDAKLDIKGQVGIENAEIKVKFNEISNLPGSAEITADYYVSAFDLKSFSGNIEYNMDGIDIDPISLSGLPDFLDSPETTLVIANPAILVSFTNPVGKYGLEGSGMISLTSTFKNGQSIVNSSEPFTLKGDHTDLAFCTPKDGYTPVKFDGLHYVLCGGNDGLPESIKVNIQDIKFAGDVTDFPLGDLGSAEGSYEFSAPLGFGQGSKVIYETTVDGWNGDALDDVNITKVKVKALCSTNLPVSIQLSIKPIDKYGKEIPVKEDSGRFEVPAKAQRHEIDLFIESINGPITDLDGISFRAVIQQDNANNTDALGPDLQIKLDDIRVTVDGYYETDF